MPFWNVRRSRGASATEGSAARDLTPVIEPVQVFTTDRCLGGWVVATQERMTDVLNARESIRLCVDATDDLWETIDRDDILLVAPPERSSDPRRRIHRRKNRIAAQLGPYLVTGTLHLTPGTQLDTYLLRTRQQFLPLTNAVVSSRVDPTFEQQLPVVIVSVRHMMELRTQLSVV
jgi:hypothetical protein